MRSSRSQLQSLARRWSGRRPSFTSLLVAASAAAAFGHWTVFALTGQMLFSHDSLSALLGLSAETVSSGSPWQFFSFALVHANWMHLLANLLPLYLAGREVEPILGSKHFVGLYLAGNLLGGVAQWGVMAAGWTPAGSVFVGVSAGVAAVVSAFATILPELEIGVLFLRVRAKRLGLALLLLGLGLWISKTATFAGPAA